MALAQARDERKGVPALKHPGDRDPLERRFQFVRNVRNHHPVAPHGFAVKAHAERGDIELLLHGEVHDAWHRRHGLADLFAKGAQPIEVFTENLHGDIRPRAGEHVVNAVRDGLPNRDVHARNEREVPAQGVKKRRFTALPHLEGDVKLGGLHPLGVLIELGPAGAPSHRDHLGMGQ